MSDASRSTSLDKTTLFARLADASGGTTVVTPNLRLAQELEREFDLFQMARGLEVWDAPDIVPLEIFFLRAHEEALYSGHGDRIPILLTPLQELSVWQQAIEASPWSEGLLSVARTAGSARDAWKKAHEWRIEGALAAWPGNEDTRAFVEWSQAYARRTRAEGYIDMARLPPLAAAWIGQGAARRPPLLVAYAFDIVTPQLTDFFAACRSIGIEVVTSKPDRVVSEASRLACKSPAEEIERAARWARDRLEAVGGRIGVVVADLALRRMEVQRVFAGVMQPGYNLPGAEKKPLPFNISLGLPLASHPLVDAALGILWLAGATSAREADFALASALVRSPFLAGADTEMTCRARLDAALREILPARLTLPRLLAAVAMSGMACPVLSEKLDALFEYSKRSVPGAKSPHEWARHFSALLDAAGFAGGRALGSEEFQTRAKFHAMLGEFARLERVVPRLGYAAALSRLRSLCADTLFQPARFGKGSEAPVQVLGILESAGLEFDHLWVSGLTDGAWPLDSRPNPFLPPALQRKAGIPEASAETALALDRRITEDWLGAAPEVVVSHALRENDRDLAPSPLIVSLPPVEWEALGVTQAQSHRDRLFAARFLEIVPDGWAPSLATTTPRGGTRILADQAACPFRAFARHRLAARQLDEPSPGLDAAARGQLLHTLFARLWGELESQAGLEKAIADGSLAGIVDTAARSAVARVREDRPGGIDERFAALECARLAKLAREWLEIERGRTPFEVVAREEKRTLEIAGLSLAGRIDRMDRLAQGGQALIDYKTGRASPKEWMDARPDDPQMPLYAVSAREQVTAVTFAKVRTGEMKFMGFSRDPDVLPKVKTVENWEKLLAAWRVALEELGHDFVHGDARVEPKRLPVTCTHCGLQPLCRVYERYGALEGDREAGADDSGESS